MTALERFIHYVKIHTASAEDTNCTPSTQRQFDLSRVLEREMKEMGMQEVFVDEHAYVYGFLEATPGCENKPSIGFVAHLDTVPDFSGENVKPTLVYDYDGGDLPLGDSGRVLVRYSGTQSLCRVMVEGPTVEMTERLCQAVADAIKTEIG